MKKKSGVLNKNIIESLSTKKKQEKIIKYSSPFVGPIQ